MEYHSKRFQSVRYSFSHLREEDLSSSKSAQPSLMPKVKKQSLKSHDLRLTESGSPATWTGVLWHYLVLLLRVFYALTVTCFGIIKICLQYIICLCQGKRPQLEALIELIGRFPALVLGFQNKKGTRKPFKSLTNDLPPLQPSSNPLFSSDSEDDSDFSCLPGESYDLWTNIHQPVCTNNNELDIDDYDLSFVRLMDNVIYYFKLYSINYPAFVREFVHCLSSQSDSRDVAYGHNITPKDKRPKIISKGIGFLKRRKLKKSRMSRVHGGDQAHKQWLLKIALGSRLLIFFMQLILTNLPKVFKHENDGFKFTPEDTYGKLLDPLINSTFGGYVNWDAHFFLHISVYGYTSENILAFFPLLPMLLQCPSRILYFLLSNVISLSSLVIVSGVLLNMLLFVKCTANIYEISTFRPHPSRQFVTTACLLFSFNPASIFFNGLYTETLFAYLTSSVILHVMRSEYLTSLAYAAMSGLCRSNGILNVGFILAFALQKEAINIKTFKIFGFAFQSVVMVALSLIPFFLFQIYSVVTFCNEGKVYNNPADVPLYCFTDWESQTLSLPYSYIQAKYWNVGFLEYFQFKQIPNFILAAPVLFVLGRQSWTTFTISICGMINSGKLLYVYTLSHAVHGIFLTFFCLCFVHVQVSTRMIMAACPYLYVYLADALVNEVEKFRKCETTLPIHSLGIIVWCIIYYVIGTIGFSLGLPWT